MAALASMLFSAVAATPWPACNCTNRTLCKPLGARSTDTPDIHVYADGGGSPVNDNWRSFNFSAISTISRMSGHPLIVQPSGAVEINPKSGWPDSDLLCTAHSHNVRVVATVLRSHDDPAFYTDLLSNKTAITRAARELAEIVAAAGFDGVEYDLESMERYTVNATFDVGAAHVSLVAQTRGAVAAAVPGATTTLTMGGSNLSDPAHVPYLRDYPVGELANASDGIFIMFYDMWHSHRVCAGPNSPYNHVEANIAGFLRLAPASKLILGMPWYGYEYRCNGSTPCTLKGCANSTCIDGSLAHESDHFRAPPYWKVQEMLSNASLGCVRGWNDMYQSPFYDCGIGPNRTQGWYDDPQSTRSKVSLARRLGLRGWGVFTADQAGSGAGAREMWNALGGN